MKYKIALVHDYLSEAGGAERVLKVLSDMYPQAPIFTAFAKNGSARKIFSDRKIVESRWGWFLKIGRFYSYFRFLLPRVWRSIDLTGYDLIISSCSGYIARGFRVKKSARVVAYCHTPPKWLYGYETPTDGKRHWWGKLYLGIVGPFIRYFDFVSAQRVDMWIANSREVAGRIEKFYRKKAIVINPPIRMNYGSKIVNYGERKEYFLTVARVVGAKGLELAAAAARETGVTLTVVGETVGGKNYVSRIMKSGGGRVTMLGRVSDEKLEDLYAQAKGYIALAKDEDFGMTVVEAMSHGVPVIALSSGGYTETVTDGVTGLFVHEPTVAAVAAAITRFQKIRWDAQKIHASTRKYSRERFEKEIRAVIEQRS